MRSLAWSSRFCAVFASCHTLCKPVSLPTARLISLGSMHGGGNRRIVLLLLLVIGPRLAYLV